MQDDHQDPRRSGEASEATTRFSGTAITAPRRTEESRIGDDATHARLQAARNAARRNPEEVVNLDDVSQTE